MTQQQSLLLVNKLACGYNDTAVLRDILFHVNQGDIFCLLGPSGCGKTTLLQTIAGFLPVLAGDIQRQGTTISSTQITLPPEKRNFGMVFQDYALFPHMTIAANIGFGLSRQSRAKRSARVAQLLELVDLEGRGSCFPHELSGGQQQRVALARALAPKPDLILFDEPFSNLDAGLRKKLSHDIKAILKDQQTGAIMVTHDQAEAFALADRIAILKDGTMIQCDSPYNLYHEPINRFVAEFVGKGTFLPGKVLDQSSVTTELGTLVGNRAYNWQAGTRVEVLLRLDDLVYAPDSPTTARVLEKTFAGAVILYRLLLPSGSEVECLFPSHIDLPQGNDVGFQVNLDHLVAFPVEENPVNPEIPDQGQG